MSTGSGAPRRPLLRPIPLSPGDAAEPNHPLVGGPLRFREVELLWDDRRERPDIRPLDAALDEVRGKHGSPAAETIREHGCAIACSNWDTGPVQSTSVSMRTTDWAPRRGSARRGLVFRRNLTVCRCGKIRSMRLSLTRVFIIVSIANRLCWQPSAFWCREGCWSFSTRPFTPILPVVSKCSGSNNGTSRNLLVSDLIQWRRPVISRGNKLTKSVKILTWTGRSIILGTDFAGL